MSSAEVLIGLETLCQSPPQGLRGASLGLLCNQASLLPDFTPAPEAVSRAFPGQVGAIFSPQHGFYSEKQDNMVESSHDTHPGLGVPIYSLYGQTRRPTPDMFSGLDVLLIDLVDVGCRVYTFFTTTAACLEEAAQAGAAVWILDRPNPLGRGEEGPILPEDLMSFVGPHAMPLRHGLSLGELCLLYKAEKGLDLDLKVIPCQGWQGGDLKQTGLGWVMPSPNLPTLCSARVYPGQVLLEGTSLSEGRGSTRPFEIFGAPGLDPWAVLDQVEAGAAAGGRLRPLFFQPTFHKYAGEVCGGFQLHITDVKKFRPVRTTLAILSAIARAHPGLWQLREPPYEYEYERRPLDLLLGDPQAVDLLAAGAMSEDLILRWEAGLDQWRERIRPHLLYPG